LTNAGGLGVGRRINLSEKEEEPDTFQSDLATPGAVIPGKTLIGKKSD